MKKTIKIISFVLLLFIIFFVFCLFYYFYVSSNYSLDEKKLNISEDQKTIFYDKNCEKFEENSFNKKVEYNDLNKNIINAFIAIEDKRFYNHKGIDYKGIARALLNNVTTFSFKEGGSTITQQLIKNTHLSNEKTINRKIAEIKLSIELEKKYSKNQIIEMYLNSIYFGDNCYGISSASNHYFSKKPSELSLNESATLAGIVKSPYNYSPTKNYENSIKRRNVVLSEMKKQGFINEIEYNSAKNENIVLNIEKKEKNKNFEYFLLNELDNILDKNNLFNEKLNIYTTLDQNYQKILENSLYQYEDISDSRSGIILSKEGKILAYSSNIGEVNRQLGSVIKPILIYAPAFEKNIIDESTLILDEKTDFDGYTVENYGDSYLGNITVKDALTVSSNVCSTKILNSLGIDNAKESLKNIDLNLSKEDNFLNLAIGSTKNGAKLSQIVSGYTPFLNDGFYETPYIITKITNEKGKTIYERKTKKTKIFEKGTCYLINDCLNNCVKEGTAKKLKNISDNLCSKTGTVGNEHGNMDVYSLTYDVNIISGIWLGNEHGELMKNTVTGGNYPTLINSDIFSSIYQIENKPNFFNKPNDIIEKNIDKISLFNDKKIELCDNNAPERYVYKTFFKTNHIPKDVSKRFSNPKIENIKYSVNNNVFCIFLCQTEYLDYKIFCISNNITSCIYDSKNEKKDTLNFNIENNVDYEFYAIPYYKNIEGERYNIAKIKSSLIKKDDWWLS